MYGDKWIIEEVQEYWLLVGGTSRKSWIVESPCQIVSEKFKFPINFHGSRKRHHWANPTPTDHTRPDYETNEGEWDDEINDTDFCERLLERIGDYYIGFDTGGWLVDASSSPIEHFVEDSLFERLIDDGEMGYSDFVIMEIILNHYIKVKRNTSKNSSNRMEVILSHYFHSNTVEFESVKEIVTDIENSDSLAKLAHLVPTKWLDEINFHFDSDAI